MPDRWVNPHGWGPPAGPPEGLEPPTQQQPLDWGSPRPPRPSAGRPWWRRWYVGLAAVLVVLGIVALSDDSDPTNTATRATPPPTTDYSLPTVATTLPTTSTIPPTTVAVVKVPKMVGMRLTSAKAALADRGLRGTVRYQTTDRYQAGTVISQSRRTGAGVLPDSTITLVVAKAPPPPKTTAPPPPTAPPRNCDPSYPDVCLDPNASDYDCAGGSGNGPKYVEGPIQVRPPTHSTWTGTATAWDVRTANHTTRVSPGRGWSSSCSRIGRSLRAPLAVSVNTR
jgi:PASTA domain